jgi:hypothetical protein
MDNRNSMSSQAVFLLFILAGLFILGIFLWRRTSGVDKPNRLHLKRNGLRPNIPANISKETAEFGAVNPGEKNLNVLFMFNGHSWDAHEVLGLPAGAGRQMIEEAYKKAIARVSPDSKDFIEAAYQALKVSLRQ